MRVKIRLERSYELFDRIVPRDAAVVDLGCGYGPLSYMLAMLSDRRRIGAWITTRRRSKRRGTASCGGPARSSSTPTCARRSCPGQTPSCWSTYCTTCSPEEQRALIERCAARLNAGGRIIIRDGDAGKAERHKTTAMTEVWSTKIVGFNKTDGELHFTSTPELAADARELGMEIHAAHKDTRTSNTVYILSRRETDRNKDDMQGQFDIIVIGSGLGGLECGAMLAREGMGVCVADRRPPRRLPAIVLPARTCDRHGHALHRQHAAGRRHHAPLLRIFRHPRDSLACGRSTRHSTSCRCPERATTPTCTVTKPSKSTSGNGSRTKRRGSAATARNLREIGGSIGIGVHRTGRLSDGGTKYLGAPAAGFIGECVADPLLRNVLAGTNPLYGGVRESSTLYHHAMVNHSNIEGACRFTGGTQQIADALAAKIREHGGTMLVRSRVVALHTEGRRITGVELADGRMLRAKTVISAIHPAETFRLIGPTPVIRKAFRERIGSLPDSYGLFSAYLLLKPGRIPYINRNLYYFAGKDVWKTLFDLEAMRPGMVLLSAQAPDGDPAWCDVVTLMTPVATRPWKAWEGSAPGRRPEAYTALKAAMTQATVDFACARLPELRDAIAHTYAATPLTYRHYTGAPHGAAYGLLKDWRSIMASHIPARTKFDNLLLTGQNLTVHGAIGVTLSAAATCSEIVGTEYLAKKIANA